MEVVDTFTYLGSQLHSSGGSEHKVNRRISISRNCMQMSDRYIWRSMISLSTKLRLYNVYYVYILPVFLYGAETWSITKAIEKRIYAFDQWYLWRIMNITWSERVTNFEVRRRTKQPLLSDTVRIDQTPEVVWPRGPRGQVTRSFPRSTSLYIASSN